MDVSTPVWTWMSIAVLQRGRLHCREAIEKEGKLLTQLCTVKPEVTILSESRVHFQYNIELPLNDNYLLTTAAIMGPEGGRFTSNTGGLLKKNYLWLFMAQASQIVKIS